MPFKRLTAATLLLATLALACSGIRLPETADDSPAPFFIAPYLAFAHDGTLRIHWWPSAGQARDELTLIDEHGQTSVLIAHRDGELYTVTLPVACAHRPVRWRYRVSGMAEPAPLVLPPCPEIVQTRFAFISDTQNFLDDIAAAALRTAEAEPRFVLHGGDLVNRGSNLQQWIDYLHAVAPFGRSVATVATLGNHETYYDETFPNYRRFFNGPGPTWYVFSAGPVDVLVHDSERVDDPQIDARQYAWFERTLATLAAAPDTDRRWRIVLTHHAPLSSSLANADYVPFGNSKPVAERYLPLFERYGVDLVLAGHTHVYERLERAGVHYLVAGTVGGFMGVLGDRHPASRSLHKARTVTVFEVDTRTLHLQTRDLEGNLLDELRLTRDDD